MLHRVHWPVLTAFILAYVAVALWAGLSGIGLALVLNLVGAIWSNALRH